MHVMRKQLVIIYHILRIYSKSLNLYEIDIKKSVILDVFFNKMLSSVSFLFFIINFAMTTFAKNK